MNEKVTDNYLRSAVTREAIKCDSSTFLEPDANLEVEQYRKYGALMPEANYSFLIKHSKYYST